MGTGAATGAGVFVPVGFERGVISAMKDMSPLLALANVVDAPDGRNHPYPSDDDVANSGELLGEGQQASVGGRGKPVAVVLFEPISSAAKSLKFQRELLATKK